ncbi:hypothetical protein JCM17960_00230 [Magnetospira thiophila]
MEILKRGQMLICGVMIAVFAVLPGSAGADETPFEDFADELIATIQRNAVAQPSLPANPMLQGMLFQAGFGQLSVAVWPFQGEDLPVPKTTADRWNEKLVAAMVRKKPAHMRMITRQHLKKLLLETQSITAFEDVVNPTETLARNAAVNFLIIGEVRAATGGVELAYKGVNVATGELVASTRHRLFPLDLGEAEGREKTLPLTAAITQAAKAIAGRGLDIETLEIYGLREEPSKRVAPFSDYFSDRLAAEIEKQISATLVDFRLKVKDATFTESSVRTRGIPITAGPKAVSGSASEPDPKSAATTFKLGGSYWVFPDRIDVNLAVQNGLGERANWTGRIGRASIPAELLADPEAQATVASVPQDDVGPIGLELSTNKGRNPRFRLGETMVLMVEVQRDAHLNCYYKQADGTAFRFFPNRHLTTGNRVKAGEINKLPGSGMPFSFTMTPPEGTETVHCFATDQAVSAKLPPALGATDLEPIPQEDFRKLSAAFRSIPGVRISEASMTVTVRN